MLTLKDISSDTDGGDLFDRYGAVLPGHHDEAFAPDGTPRAHWSGLLDWIGQVGSDGYRAAAADLARLRNESGVAFALKSESEEGLPDALPVILSADDWRDVSEGIAQRAALADAAVSDVYTSQRAIAAGLIPPGLVYGGPAFAAHCAGWERPPRHFMHVYEADIGRTAEGEWVVLADRVDAPLGDGWLLANRIAATQAYADLFVDLGVRRLASHYAAFQDHLDQMMGWEGRLALLTAGEHDPRFFSHAYFARYMSGALIEPADLTIRDGSAFVKTLGGLKRIDVLLRGVPDSAIDALHRPGRAAFGAPALSLAARSGSLKLVNAIGCAVFGFRALAPYAHRLAHHLIGEDLKLPDAPCLWLGGARAREQVLEERDKWRIESLTTRDSPWPEDPENDEPLLDQLARVGERYCAVRTPELAHTPVWDDKGLRPAQWMMRVFASRTENGWSVAPGGVASIIEPGAPSPALGFGKDVWVLPDDERRVVPQISGHLTKQIARGHLRRTGRDLLSRVADELYWLGRNVERAEQVLRVLSVCLNRHLDANRTDASPLILARLAEIHAKPAPHLADAERYRDAIQRLIRDPAEPGGVPAILSVLRSGSLRARSSISGESWRYIERLCSDKRWRATGPVRQNASLASLLDESVQSLAAFAGSSQENLTRNYAWRFLEIGRRIERGVQIASIAENLAGSSLDTEETYLRAWLTLSDSAVAYRSRYMMTAETSAVIDLLFLDETNPRSLGYQLEALERVLSELPTESPYRRPEHRRALSLLTDLRLMDADVLAETDSDGKRPALVDFSVRCQDELAEISDLLSRAFFAHTDTPEALVSQARQEPL